MVKLFEITTWLRIIRTCMPQLTRTNQMNSADNSMRRNLFISVCLSHQWRQLNILERRKLKSWTAQVNIGDNTHLCLLRFRSFSLLPLSALCCLSLHRPVSSLSIRSKSSHPAASSWGFSGWLDKMQVLTARSTISTPIKQGGGWEK